MQKVVYTRYSDERDPAFAVYTQILETESRERIVRKYAENPVAQAHLRHIFEAGFRLGELYGIPGGKTGVNRCRECEGALELEYLDGETLEEQMDRLLREQGSAAVMEALREYISSAVPKDHLVPFRATEEFCEWFGSHDFPEETMSLPVSDIDMICANVICADSRRWLIDYEWTFFFPVPAKFLIFRILYYYTAYGTMRQQLNRDSIYEEYGISPEDIRTFQEMEFSFQKKIQGGHVPLRSMYDSISPGTTEAGRLLAEKMGQTGAGPFEVFYAYGKDFVPEPEQYQIRNGRVDLEIPVPEDARLIRLDPGNIPCICQIQLLAFDGKSEKIPRWQTNGKRMADKVVVFDGIDPQIWFPVCSPHPKVLSVSISINYLQQAMLDSIASLAEKEEQQRRRAEWVPLQVQRVKNKVSRKHRK